MKTIGGILLAIAFCLASGVDANPVQGVCTLVLMGVAWVLFHLGEREEKALHEELKNRKKLEDAA